MGFFMNFFQKTTRLKYMTISEIMTRSLNCQFGIAIHKRELGGLLSPQKPAFMRAFFVSSVGAGYSMISVPLDY